MRLEGKEHPEYLDKDGYMKSEYMKVVTFLANKGAFSREVAVTLEDIRGGAGVSSSFMEYFCKCNSHAWDLFYCHINVGDVRELSGEHPIYVWLRMDNPIVEKEVSSHFRREGYLKQVWEYASQFRENYIANFKQEYEAWEVLEGGNSREAKGQSNWPSDRCG